MLYPRFLSNRSKPLRAFYILSPSGLTTILGDIKDDYSNRISATTGTIDGEY